MQQTGNTHDHDLLIQLDTKIDGIAECLDGLSEWKESINTRMRTVEEAAGRRSEKVTAVQADVNGLKNVNHVWNVINSLAVALAMFFAGTK